EPTSSIGGTPSYSIPEVMSEYDSSSTLPEIEQRQMRLRYRCDWLQALFNETILELKLILKVEELGEEQNQDVTISEREILKFANSMPSVLLDFEKKAETPEEIQQRQQQLEHYRACFKYLLDDTQRELTILAEIIQSLQGEAVTSDGEEMI
ncbi:MAG: hypothetical protein ACKPFK_12890, partial [Dolichospermum sp.]